jgi:hypothetical protein
MDNQPQHRVELRGPGELIAAIPALLGHRPTDCLIAVAFHQHQLPTLASINLALLDEDAAADLLTSAVTRLRLALALALRDPHADAVHLVVAAGRGRLGVLDPVRSALAAQRVPVAHTVWTPAIEHGARWWCCDGDPDCYGKVPDPAASVIAAVMVAAGKPLYGSRADLAATLHPHEDPQTLEQRAARIVAAHATQPAPGQPAFTAHRYTRTIAHAIARARHRLLPDSEDQLVDLAMALADRRRRDAALTYHLGADAQAAMRLWTALVRRLPAPYRAEPAVLLAVGAHLAGDGVLANVAIETALQAAPAHPLSILMSTTFSLLSPQDFRAILAETIAELRHGDHQP